MADQHKDRRRRRFRDAEAIRSRIGSEWPEAFTDEVLQDMRLEVEGLAWDVAPDVTLALAGEHAGIGARRLRGILDPGCSVQVCHNRLVRGRMILERLRRPATRIEA